MEGTAWKLFVGLVGSVASVGFAEGRNVKDFWFADTHGFNLCMAFQSVLDAVPWILCFAKNLMNILGFFHLPTLQIEPYQIQVIKMHMFCIKVLEGPDHRTWYR